MSVLEEVQIHLVRDRHADTYAAHLLVGQLQH